MKKYLYILGGAVAIVLVAIGIFWLLAKSRPAATPGSTGTLPQTGTQGSSNGTTGAGTTTGTSSAAGGTVGDNISSTLTSFGIISQDPAINYFVDPQNNVLLVKTDGEIEKITGGQSSTLSTSTITDIISAQFSYNGQKIAISSGDRTNPQTTIFDIASKSWTSLPIGYRAFAWAPSDLRLAYFTSASTGTLALSVIDASTAKRTPTTLLTLNANALSLHWINNTQILFSDDPSSYAAGSLWLFDTVKKTLLPVITDRNGLEYIWSGAASTSVPLGLVWSSGSSNGQGGFLELDDLGGTVIQQLNFTTLPSKCVFNTETPTSSKASSLVLYCGIPRNQGSLSFANLPDAYNQMALFTSDDFYQINLTTGAITTIWNDANQNIDASAVKFFNNTLFFINRYDQKLYGLVLNQPAQ